MGTPVQPALFLSSLADFQAGMNSDVPPIALPKNQAAFSTNCTMRGNFVTYRPPFIDFALTFPSADVQSFFETGLFQGASFYDPDFGSESCIASIAGRLFKVTPDQFNSTATVIDITPDDGPNSATTPKAWLWQGENYEFVNDGQNATIVFDDQTSRRLDIGSTIATVQTGATIAGGASAQITLTANYTGQYNVPLNVFTASNVLLGQFQAQQLSSGYNATLTNINDAPGATHTGEPLIIPGSYASHLTFGGTVPANSPSFMLTVDDPYTGPVGGKVGFGALLAIKMTVIAKDLTIPNITVKNDDPTYGGTNVLLAAGTLVTRYPSVADQTVATLAASFTAPDIGGSVVVTLDQPYVGPNGATITIDGALYTISAVAPPASNQIYLLNLDPLVSKTIAAGYTLRTIPQLPPGKQGAYGLGRNWVALTDGKSYLASDIVGSSSGTAAFNFRDSILNVTENNYLAGGGVFRVPGSGQTINALAFPCTLDSSLGQGPLQVLTQSTVFSCNAPVERSQWQIITNPIQTQSLVGAGSLGDTVIVNGDIWFRSWDGIYSLKLARQDFQVSYANTPQSTEMSRVLIEDDRTLLYAWNGIRFDNRLLTTATPVQSPQGVFHRAIVAMNLDPQSNLRTKEPAIYDGIWTGRNIFKLIVGTFNGVERAFAFTYNETTSKIGLSELQITQSANNFDNGTDRIQWSFESPALFYQPDTRKRELLKLADGEIFVKDLVGDTRFDVYYRPDWALQWTPWHSWEVADVPNWQPRMGLGSPVAVDSGDKAGRPTMVGYFFQVLVIVTGACTFMGMNAFATTQPVTSIAPPIANDPPLTPLAV
jgi:hypothetical protein